MSDAMSTPGLDAHLAAALSLATAHALAIETLSLSRSHGRVLGRPLVVDGRTVLDAGLSLTPARVALAASHGVAALEVTRRPTVAVFTVGDHLVSPGMPCTDGQAYDATRELVMGLLRADGLEPTAWPCLPEDPVRIEIALRDAGCAFDLIVVCTPPTASGAGAVVQVVERFGEVRLRAAPGEWASTPLLGRLDEACVLGLPDDPVTVLGLHASVGRTLIDGLQRRSDRRAAVRVQAGAVQGGISPGWAPVRLIQSAGSALRAEPGRADASDADAVIEPAGSSDGYVRAWLLG